MGFGRAWYQVRVHSAGTGRNLFAACRALFGDLERVSMRPSPLQTQNG